MVRRALLLVLLTAVMLSVFAANYPRKPVTIICPWGAGGGTDRLARFLADELSKKLVDTPNPLKGIGFLEAH